jgi:hypothetical protein
MLGLPRRFRLCQWMGPCDSVAAIMTRGSAWIPERSATRLREADLNVLSKLGNQGLVRPVNRNLLQTLLYKSRAIHRNR